MADKKISQLTAVSTPLAGTEVLPIVQSGATKKVTALELTGVNVTADGRVGVGGVPDTTINGSPITAKFGVHQDGGSINYHVVGAVKYSDVTSTAGVTICGARGRGSKATPTVVSNGDLLSSHIAAGYDGTDFAISSRINFEVDGTPGNDDMPGRIVFLTSPDGSQTPVEGFRINSDKSALFSGNLNVGVKQNGAEIDLTGSMKLRPAGPTAYGYQVSITHVAGTVQKMLSCRYLGPGTTSYIDIGSIAAVVDSADTNAYSIAILNKSGVEQWRVNSEGHMVNAATYSSSVGGTNRPVYVDNNGNIGYLSSLIESKTNIVNIDSADWILGLRPVTFNRREQNSAGEYLDTYEDTKEFGLIAEEVEQVNKDFCLYDQGEGGPELRGVAYDKMVIPLIKLVQKQQEEINFLRAEINTIKGI